VRAVQLLVLLCLAWAICAPFRHLQLLLAIHLQISTSHATVTSMLRTQHATPQPQPPHTLPLLQPSSPQPQVLDQMNLDSGYALWPSSQLQYSAVGLDVGYWDGGYYWLGVNQLNASQLGGSQNFFLHVSRDAGGTWEAPFTRYRDCGPRAAGKRWSSTGERLRQLLLCCSITCLPFVFSFICSSSWSLLPVCCARLL
jgi:hypothetical protein